MAEGSREDEALVAKSAALIIGRLDDKLAEIARSIQELLFTELSGDRWRRGAAGLGP